VCGFDETALFLGNPSSTTVAIRGSKTIAASSGSIDKFRITAIFGGYGNGRKLTPYLLWHSTKDVPELITIDVGLRYTIWCYPCNKQKIKVLTLI
jgi:hypothetical protein